MATVRACPLTLLLCACLLLPAGTGWATEGTLRPLLIGLGVAGGIQPDSRSCATGGVPLGSCVLFSAGVDVSFLWRGRVGGMVGLYSASGQAVLPTSQSSQGQPPAAFPDRISLPLALDVRPLSFLVGKNEVSYSARALSGVGLRLGPSLEIVRTSSDQDVGAGLYFALQAELPLHGAARNGVSLRWNLNVLYAPQVALNDGAVRSSNFDTCAPGPDCIPITEHKHGYAGVFQTFLGLVYYP